MLFPLWILFWLVFTSGLLFLDSDGFLWISLKWHCLEQKMSSEKRGPFFWFPKIFTVPKNHGASLRGRSGGEGSLRFHWDHHWLDQFFARWNQGTLPKWVRKGGRKLDFPVGCLFFFPQNRHVVPKISGKRDGKMIFKIRGRGIQGWSTTRIMFGFLLSNTLNTTQTLLSFFDAASANMSPPPSHVIPFGLMPATASENRRQVAFSNREFDSRQVFGNPWPFPFPHLSTFQPQGDPAQSTAISNEQANLYASLTEYSLRVNEEKIRQCMRWVAERV